MRDLHGIGVAQWCCGSSALGFACYRLARSSSGGARAAPSIHGTTIRTALAHASGAAIRRHLIRSPSAHTQPFKFFWRSGCATNSSVRRFALHQLMLVALRFVGSRICSPSTRAQLCRWRYGHASNLSAPRLQPALHQLMSVALQFVGTRIRASSARTRARLVTLWSHLQLLSTTIRNASVVPVALQFVDTVMRSPSARTRLGWRRYCHAATPQYEDSQSIGSCQ